MQRALIVQDEVGQEVRETLVEEGVPGEREVVDVLAELLHMPVVDLRRDNPDPRRSSSCPKRSCVPHMAMPIRLDDDGLQIAVADLPSEEAAHDIVAVESTTRSGWFSHPSRTFDGRSTVATGS